MKKRSLLISLSLVSLLYSVVDVRLTVAQSTAPSSSQTLYSVRKPKREPGRDCVSFRTQTSARDQSKPCDLRFDFYYVGDEPDWFDLVDADRRTVVKDLGKRSWSDPVTVSALQPLPELKLGEHRSVLFVAARLEGPLVKDWDQLGDRAGVWGDGKRKADPFWTKVILGHLYEIHVVDGQADLYALFRVDNLKRADNCTISWRVIPSPETPAKVRN